MVKFLDIKKVTASYQSQIHEALLSVADEGWYVQGKALAAFEKSYAQYIGTTHCVGCGNGLDAISLVLKAYIEMGRIKPGDDILVSANTFIATILAITENGLNPVFVDAKDCDGQMDEALLEGLLTSKTSALLLVHLYGACAYNERIAHFCKVNHLLLIEDNAQAHGCMYQQQRTGSLGDAAAHSFYPGKNLGALGDGGAVTTNDSLLAQTIRELSNYGQSEKYKHDRCGCNSRLDEIQAAVLSVKLKHLDEANAHRRLIANYYRTQISNPLVSLPKVSCDENAHVYHLFPIRCDKRDELQSYLKQHGVETGIHYPVPPHKQNCYNSLYGHLCLPVTERIHAEELSLPISPVMTLDEAKQVVDAVNAFRK